MRQGKEIDLPESCARQSWPSARAHALPLSRLLSQSRSLTTHLALRGLFDETKAAGEHVVRRLLLTHFGPRRFPTHPSCSLPTSSFRGHKNKKPSCCSDSDPLSVCEDGIEKAKPRDRDAGGLDGTQDPCKQRRRQQQNSLECRRRHRRHEVWDK